MNRKKVATVLGTRPEAIKLALLIKEFESSKNIKHFVVSTGQHREMIDQVFKIFNINLSLNLDLMKTNQKLWDFSSSALKILSEWFVMNKPDLVIVQGDTSTAMIAALAAFYNNISVGHVEAGLRSDNIYSPFPEEVNRKIISQIATFNFTPTKRATEILLKENIKQQSIFQVGNTIVDVVNRMKNDSRVQVPLLDNLEFKKMIFVTFHRRENFGKPIQNICDAILEISLKRPDIVFLITVHPNPNVKDVIEKKLSGLNNVILSKPLDYYDLMRAINQCYFILTDSGGIQEEAISFNRPVLILRNNTERPEVIEAGGGKLIGTDIKDIVQKTFEILDDSDKYKRMTNKTNPFGDGNSSVRIRKIIEN